MSKNNEVFIPETLDWCCHHYVPKNPAYITCKEFGRCDGMDGSCWWCMEMTPYQWHMCVDEAWIQSLLRPISKQDLRHGKKPLPLLRNINRGTLWEMGGG